MARTAYTLDLKRAWRLKKTMEKRGMSPAALAELVGRNEDTVRRWRDGRTGADIEDWEKMADQLQVSRGWLLHDWGTPEGGGLVVVGPTGAAVDPHTERVKSDAAMLVDRGVAKGIARRVAEEAYNWRPSGLQAEECAAVAVYEAVLRQQGLQNTGKRTAALDQFLRAYRALVDIYGAPPDRHGAHAVAALAFHFALPPTGGA